MQLRIRTHLIPLSAHSQSSINRPFD